VDAVLDAVGGDTQTRSFSVLKPNGRLISSVTAPDQAEAKRCGVTASWILVDVNRSDLENIANLLDSGELKPSVGAVLPLSEAVAAHEMLAGTRPRPRGKIVLKAFA
jgi:NADPH:quinone reductase-like Zn-dependent oxidoreductase